MKPLYIVITLLLLCGLCGCASNNSIDIPADSVRFRIVTVDNQPVAGVEMGCTSPWVNGERNDDYCLMGTTDENGCLLWKGVLGEIDFDVEIQGQKLQTFTRMITEKDFGKEIVFTVNDAEP